MSMRRAASWIQPLQVRSGPRGARMTRGPPVGRVAVDMAAPFARQGGAAFGLVRTIILAMSRTSPKLNALQLTGDGLTLDDAECILRGQVERLSLAPVARQ